MDSRGRGVVVVLAVATAGEEAHVGLFSTVLFVCGLLRI